MPARHILETPRILCSYSGYNTGYDKLKISEAVRATSAAPRLFKEILVGDSDLEEALKDGGMGCNNSVKIVVDEVLQTFDPNGQVACIVSIGTGVRKLIKELASFVTSSEAKASNMDDRYRKCPGLCRRLNVDRSLEEISLEEWKKLGEVRTYSMRYIEKNFEVSKAIDAIVDALIGNLQQTYALKDLDGSVQSRIEEFKLIDYPHFRAAYFVPRDNELKKMAKILDEPGIETFLPRIFVLQGLGGCGKSQLPLEYCRLSLRPIIFWIDASSIAQVHQAFTIIAQKMSKPSFDAKDHEVNAQFFVERLRSHEKWLLVFDNCDYLTSFEKSLKSYFPQNGSGSIIITTRHFGVRAFGYSCDLSKMSKEEGCELLLHRSQISKDPKSLEEPGKIVETLGFLGLAIDQAGAYIVSRKLDIACYLNHYKEHRENLLKKIPAL